MIPVDKKLTFLDGGMGRQLLKMGAPFRQPEWSALALMEGPDFVRQAHRQFAAAGSDIITSNSYAVVPFHLGDSRFKALGSGLVRLSGQLARQVAEEFQCQVAGSLPPLFGSYRPDLFREDDAQAVLQVLIEALDVFIDIWLAETLSSIAEARAVAKSIEGDRRPLWISFTLDDRLASSGPRLRSGETVPMGVRAAAELGAAALLFNCSPPEVMASAIEQADDEMLRLGLQLPIGAYANAFQNHEDESPANSAIHDIRHDL
ncbi:MAG TPA: homocysteine S-methyltransferase family protein, partial [Desulfopila sp.]|nr:homocysteine S-methyltransferase family protein [Desulfopila sp.]